MSTAKSAEEMLNDPAVEEYFESSRSELLDRVLEGLLGQVGVRFGELGVSVAEIVGSRDLASALLAEIAASSMPDFQSELAVQNVLVLRAKHRVRLRRLLERSRQGLLDWETFEREVYSDLIRPQTVIHSRIERLDGEDFLLITDADSLVRLVSRMCESLKYVPISEFDPEDLENLQRQINALGEVEPESEPES